MQFFLPIRIQTLRTQIRPLRNQWDLNDVLIKFWSYLTKKDSVQSSKYEIKILSTCTVLTVLRRFFSWIQIFPGWRRSLRPKQGSANWFYILLISVKQNNGAIFEIFYFVSMYSKPSFIVSRDRPHVNFMCKFRLEIRIFFVNMFKSCSML